MQTGTYNNPDFKITTRYSVEYLTASSENGAQRWKLYQTATQRVSSFNPWELVDRREFDDVGAAWQFYLARLLDKQTFVLHPIFEQIEVNGVLAREAYIEETPTFHWNLRAWVDREMRNDLDRAQREVKSGAELLGDYIDFIEMLDNKYHGKLADDFRKYHFQKEEERNA